MQEQTETTMKTAFRKAGKEPADDRWKRLVKEAREKHPRSSDAFVEHLGTLVCEDAELLWAKIAPHWRSIALSAIAKWGLVDVDAHSRKPPAPSHVNNNEAASAANNAMGRTLLMEEMTELGKPVGDLTGAECVALSRRHSVRFRYFGWLGQQVSGNAMVRSVLRESHLAEMKRAAEKENDSE